MLFWYLLTSLRATVPALFLLFLLSLIPPAAGADFLTALEPFLAGIFLDPFALAAVLVFGIIAAKNLM